jgi:hypothetical protein
MNCRHCHQQLPEVHDAFCPHCRGELAHDDPTDAIDSPSLGRKRLWIAVAIAAGLALLLLPLLTLPLAGLAFLGLACARSAILNRPVGWIMGLFLGVLLATAGLAGIVAIMWWRFQ